MPNELLLNEPRLGALIDFDPLTPEVQVTLERTDKSIQATIPWIDESSPYASWFLPTDFGDPYARPAGEVPSRLLFADSHGSILLLDCAVRGFHSSFRGAGSGRIVARAAVLSVQDDVDYEHPDGLVSHVSGLREWRGVTSWGRDRPGEREVSFTTLDVPALEIGTYRGFSLAFNSTWSVRPGEDRESYALTDSLEVRTTTRDYRPWEEHLDLHHAVRDLLVLSRWHRESCIPKNVRRRDNPSRNAAGGEMGEGWPSIIVADTVAAPPAGYRPHLIPYEALQDAGILRWLSLREEFARALDPIISCKQLRQATPHTVLAHTGPGLEALGYLLLRQDGDSETKAGRSTLQTRLERIQSDIAGVATFASADWPVTWASAYNAVKHANRDLPDETALLNAWREAVLAVRTWVALRLGVPPNHVRRELELDPQSNPYVPVRRSTSPQ